MIHTSITADTTLPFIAPHSVRLARLERRISGRTYGHGAVAMLRTRRKLLKARMASLGAELRAAQ